MLNEATLTEGYGSAILPAGRVLFNKNKVTPNHAASKAAGVWGDGDQSVRTYEHEKEGKYVPGKGTTTSTQHFHVSSSGHYDPADKNERVKIGGHEQFQHDQSQKRLPSGKLVGVSNYKDGVKINHHGVDHSETKAPFHVYK